MQKSRLDFKITKRRKHLEFLKTESLPFEVGVLEVLLVRVRVRACRSAAAALSGFDGVDHDQDEEEDSQDAADDHGDQRFLRNVFCKSEEENLKMFSE